VGEVECYNPILNQALAFTSYPTSISIHRRVNLDFFIGQNTPWFLDSELSGGIVVDLMIHDLSLLIQKFGKPTIKNVKGTQNIYSDTDEVEVILKFKYFEANLYADWCSQNKENPISVIWQVEQDLEIKNFISQDYLKSLSLEVDPYYIQDKYFLLNLKMAFQDNKVNLTTFHNPLETYLQAVEVADEIKNQINNKKQSF